MDRSEGDLTNFSDRIILDDITNDASQPLSFNDNTFTKDDTFSDYLGNNEPQLLDGISHSNISFEKRTSNFEQCLELSFFSLEN
jgi:hypothetical protein